MLPAKDWQLRWLCRNCESCEGVQLCAAVHRADMAAPKRDYDYLFKLVIIGDSGVGKSSLLLRFAVRIGRIAAAT